MKYRTVTYFKGQVPIYAKLETSAGGSKTPPKVIQEHTTAEYGPWIDNEEFRNFAIISRAPITSRVRGVEEQSLVC